LLLESTKNCVLSIRKKKHFYTILSSVYECVFYRAIYLLFKISSAMKESNSSMFYALVFCAAFLNVSRKKLRKALLYKKIAHKMLMKLTKGVNFINILCTNFLYESPLSSFSLLRVWLWTNFCMKNSRVKCWWNWLKVFSFFNWDKNKKGN